MKITLASSSVKVADDPRGVHQRERLIAQRGNLEVKYHDAIERRAFDFAYAYTFDLLQKELEDETKGKKTPSGPVGSAKSTKSLNSFRKMSLWKDLKLPLHLVIRCLITATIQVL